MILRSDRGGPFTSRVPTVFEGTWLVCSMSAEASCADNAVAESLFGMLKRERVRRRKYLTRAEARADILDYIERIYNPAKRRKLERNGLGLLALNQIVRRIRVNSPEKRTCMGNASEDRTSSRRRATTLGLMALIFMALVSSVVCLTEESLDRIDVLLILGMPPTLGLLAYLIGLRHRDEP